MNITQTVLQYNGVRLQNVQTLLFEEQAINDSSGQYIYTKTVLKVLGYFTQSKAEYLGPILQNGVGISPPSVFAGASSQFNVLKHFLGQPRRRLIYSTVSNGTVGNSSAEAVAALGTPLFIIEPAPEFLTDPTDDMKTKHDVQAGPVPGPISITSLANDQTWRVEFTVTFHTASPCLTITPATYLAEGDSINAWDDIESQVTVPDTFTGDQRKHGVLSNRWSCADMIDENGYTSRKYSGTVVLANSNWNPNDFRALTVPVIVPGMVRKSIDYAASEDNLTLRYTIHDQEVSITPPDGARNIKVIHNEGFDKPGAVIGFTIRVILHADRLTALHYLKTIAEAIVDQRLYVTPGGPDLAKKHIFVIRRDYTTEQGSDGSHMLTFVVTGNRTMEDNGGIDARIKRLRDKAMVSLTWRPVQSQDPNNILFSYNNVLSIGNRPGEFPIGEGSIPALSCLHAKLVQVCSDDQFAMDASTPGRIEIEDRLHRQSVMQATLDYTPANDAYINYPIDLSLQIDDNLAREPVSITTNIASTESQNALYNHYTITSTYGAKGLNVALPIAQTTGTPAKDNVMVSIGPRQHTRTIRIVAERIGDKPRLPKIVESFREAAMEYPGAPTNNEATFTLHDVKYQYLQPSPVADGTSLIYTTYMDLVYFIDKRPKHHVFGIPDDIAIHAASPGLNPINNKDNYKITFSTTPAVPPIETDLTSWDT